MKPMTHKIVLPGLLALTCQLGATAACAHATIDPPEAPAGAYAKASVSITHGCGGSPTVRVRVRIPEGVLSVKPQPKAGWQVSTSMVKLAKPVDVGHGRSVSESVGEVVWSGGSLANDHFDEFRIAIKLPDRPATTLYFPVVQECRQGVHRWIELPSAGKAPADLKEPAPGLRLTAKP